MRYLNIAKENRLIQENPIIRVTSFQAEDQEIINRIDAFMTRFRIREIQVRDFDSIVVHSSIVMIRYAFLAVEQRCCSDDRTIGSLFLNTSEEIQDLSLAEALARILSSVWNKALKLYSKSEELVMEIVQTTMKEALALIRPGVLAKCES